MLEALTPQPQDKILVLMAQFREDPRAGKIDLGVGVYKDATGLTPVMRAVKTAEKQLWEREVTKTYTGLAGEPAFHAAMTNLILGPGFADRAAVAATPGGTGALHQALELIKMASPKATVWVSDPTWPNHTSIIRYLGLNIAEYRYFDAKTCGIDLPGLLEELGKVQAIQVLPDAIRLTIEGPLVVSDVNRGDSISVSGACLTAVEHDATSFTADVMQETLKLTSLDGIQVGDPVNLERAMTAATRFGGHVVLGHVDGVGEVISREPSENWEWVRVSVPKELMKYVVLKGSITLDGISLTVNELGEDWVGLSLIPETLSLTTLGSKQPGSKVNVEVDVMAKHIERLIEARNN